MTETHCKSELKLTNDTPYVALTGEPWSVSCEDLVYHVITAPRCTWNSISCILHCHDICDIVFKHTVMQHYGNVIMSAMASQITSLTIACATVYSGADQRKHQSSASLAFVWGIHRWPVNSPHKGPVTRKMFPFDDVIMRKFRYIVAYKARVLCKNLPLFTFVVFNSHDFNAPITNLW